jgi:hypothetical protein
MGGETLCIFLIMDSKVKNKIKQFLLNGQINECLQFIELIEDTTTKQISSAQRGALHLYLSQVAHEANNKGLTLQNMVEVVKKLEIKPTTSNLKETFLKPYILSAYQLTSSEKMSNQQIDESYDALNKLFSYYFDIHFPFPSEADKPSTLANIGKARQINYPEDIYNGEQPTI